jgi:hypothetical protein
MLLKPVFGLRKITPMSQRQGEQLLFPEWLVV